MKRRNFLIGTGGAVIGGSALIGSGAFSRVESDRAVNIEVAKDPDAYLGLDRCDSPNSENYTDLDEKGHGYVEISYSGNDGEGVNSNSTTYFDDLFKVCNQGKADMDFKIDATGLEPADDGIVEFYQGSGAGGGEVTVIGSSEHNDVGEISIPLGECECIGLRTKTHGVNAKQADELVDGTVTLIADAPEAGEPNGE